MNTYIVNNQIIVGISLQSVLLDLGYDDIDKITGYKGKYVVTLKNENTCIFCFWLEKIIENKNKK